MSLIQWLPVREDCSLFISMGPRLPNLSWHSQVGNKDWFLSFFFCKAKGFDSPSFFPLFFLFFFPLLLSAWKSALWFLACTVSPAPISGKSRLPDMGKRPRSKRKFTLTSHHYSSKYDFRSLRPSFLLVDTLPFKNGSLVDLCVDSGLSSSFSFFSFDAFWDNALKCWKVTVCTTMVPGWTHFFYYAGLCGIPCHSCNLWQDYGCL